MWRGRWTQLTLIGLLLLLVLALGAQPVAAQDDVDDYLEMIQAIRELIQTRDVYDVEARFADHAATQQLLERESIRVAIELVAVGTTLVDLLPGGDEAEQISDASSLGQMHDCGSIDGIPIPCWGDFLSEGEGDESLPYYPYAKRANGCSIPGDTPGSGDTITLFNITISFADICNTHDRCYYTLGTRAWECNEAFTIGLRRHCEREISAHALNGWDVVTFGASTATVLQTCYTKAKAMAVGVIGAQAICHPKAQRLQQEYLDRVDAYLEEMQAKATPP
jgi:hypothetical protein